MSLAEAHRRLVAKEISAVELTKEHLQKIREWEPKINAFITVNEEEALAQATEVDKKGDFTNPLAGIPIAIKDVFCTKNLKTTAASKMLANFIPPYDATSVAKLRAGGGIFLGKVSTDEFTMGGSNETSAFGAVKNPWDFTRISGGSSGGSVAAVASGECIFATGTDTGGSIRQPASFCGCTGLKPTYGRISRFGVISMASSCDTIGVITQTAEDAAIVLKELAGADGLDATAPKNPAPENYLKFLEDKKDLTGLRIGIPKEYFTEGLDLSVEKITRNAIEILKKLGAEIKAISLPHTKYAVPVYYLIMASEVSANLARFDGIRFGHVSKKEANSLLDFYEQNRTEGFGPEVKRRIMLGTYALSAGYYDAYYLKALKVRVLIREDFIKAFEEVDLIATPTAPTTAWKLGEKIDDPLQMYLADIFTVPANLAGIPGISIPCGFAENLPVGFQLMAKHFDESTLLHAAHIFQKNTDFHKKKPSL